MANNGLITLHTDLKSLRYGSIPLGSDKPYVTKDIGEAPGSQIGAEISHRIDDVSRIAKMLVDKPGIKYLLNEALLQQVNVGQRIKKAQQGGKSLVGAVLQQAGSTLLTTAKIAGSTLAQVPVNGTGTHFLKGFRTDTYLQPSGPGNISAFASFFGAGGIEGAQYALRGEVVPTNVQTQFYKQGSTINNGDITNPGTGKPSTLSYDAKVFTEDYGTVNTNIVDNRPLPKDDANRLAAYNATAGQPITVIPSGSGLSESTLTPNTDSSISSNFNSPLTYQDNTTPGNVQPIQEINPDAYDSLSKYINLKLSTPSNNGNITKESRVGLGDQGANDRSAYPNTKEKQNARKLNNYWFMSDTKDPLRSLEVDKINALDVSTERVNGVKAARDLVKFYFEIITPDGSNFLHFRAFIDSVDDKYNANWEGHKYVGRAEDFYTYGGFSRDISVTFKVAAATRAEMKPLYRKMVYLASSTAPTYGGSGGSTFMRGTLAKMTIGSYFSQLPGVITGVSYTLDKDSPWEIAMNNPEITTDDDMQELPMVLTCSVTFKVIHDFAPQTGLYHYMTSPIGLNGSKTFLKDKIINQNDRFK